MEFEASRRKKMKNSTLPFSLSFRSRHKGNGINWLLYFPYEIRVTLWDKVKKNNKIIKYLPPTWLMG